MNFKSKAIELKLNEMFNKKSHFSICDLKDVAASIGTNPSAHPDYKYLKLLHCVNYSDMGAEMLNELQVKVMDVLSCGFDTSLMAKALMAVSTGEIKDQPCIEDVYIDNIRRIK